MSYNDYDYFVNISYRFFLIKAQFTSSACNTYYNVTSTCWWGIRPLSVLCTNNLSTAGKAEACVALICDFVTIVKQ